MFATTELPSFPNHPAKLRTAIEIPFECAILTDQAASAMVSAVLDLLMFERKQIPMVYPTFKYMVERLPLNKPPADSKAAAGSKAAADSNAAVAAAVTAQPDVELTGSSGKLEDGDGGADDWANFLLNAERICAQKTLYCIKAMKQSIAAQITALPIDRVLIVFGPNGLMASEAFDIHLPAVNRRHFSSNHREHRAAVHDVARKLANVLNDELATSVRHRAAHVFALVHSADSSAGPALMGAGDSKGRWMIHHNYELHPDCRLTTVRLCNTYVAPAKTGLYVDDLNCCGDLRVFDGPAMKSQSCGELGAGAGGAAAAATTNEMWYESSVSVPSFRDKPVNGKPIWV